MKLVRSPNFFHSLLGIAVRMSAIGYSTEDTMEDLLKYYLNVLNAKQRDVDAIRQMHHDIWKESRVYPIIKQHRSGSRVEKQLRISQVGKQSDIDYTFEVTGIEVNCNGHGRSSIYWRTSSVSSAYGKVFVTAEYKEVLQKTDYYSQIFTNEVFEFDEAENNFMLVPRMFKENVVRMSGFDYQKHRETAKSATSPSVPGQGAVNEYDVVPCLRLKEWPSNSEMWKGRVSEDDICILNSKWRQDVVLGTPLFLVPTGNPMSTEREQEFRLSFSQPEIKCFEQITTNVRIYYGLGKYLFKTILAEGDFIDTYHVKTILLWMVEEKSLLDWKNMTPNNFLTMFFDKINSAITNQTIKHFFVADCNIFPKHKVNEEKKVKFKNKMAILNEEISSNIEKLLRYDLKIKATDAGEIVRTGLKALEEELPNDAYVAGYLTRLLSVITFSLCENEVQETLEIAVRRVRKVFQLYKEDKHIGRIIPMVNATLSRMLINASPPQNLSLHDVQVYDVDEVSKKAHFAFEAYHHKEFEKARQIINEIEFGKYKPNGFGISVTSYHKNKLDEQLNFVITALERESKYGKSPRFYLDPFLVIKHLQIQLDHMDQNNISSIQKLLEDLECIVESLSNKEPYLGRLSYKFSGVYLLHGYKNFKLHGVQISLSVPSKYPLGSFNQGMFAGNFNLR